MTAENTDNQTIEDDIVLPFEVKPLGSRGRVVRLGAVIDEILTKHDYPESVSRLLGEAVSLVALLGSALKFEGKLILQTQTNGPVSLIVANYTSNGSDCGHVRGYAHFDAEAVAACEKPSKLIGKGHLALTIDQGDHMDNYQGIVALNGQTISDAAHGYFKQSEQIPTALKLAAGEIETSKGKSWRAGAIIIQHMPADGNASPVGFPSGDPLSGSGGGFDENFVEDENWARARVLLETVEDHELLDPTLEPERLLYRLYHEDGVTAYDKLTLEHKCTCSREKVIDTLSSFSQEDRDGMVVDGQIEVTCQFCSNVHKFKAGTI